jgi:hypothetical protein
MEKDTSVKDRLKRMKRMYETEGIRRTVDGILLVHKHGHPHILLLQIGNTFWKLFVGLIPSLRYFFERLSLGSRKKSFSYASAVFPRPGGKIKPGESEIEGLKRKLTSKLAPNMAPEYAPRWEVGELMSMWWRPNFETLMVRSRNTHSPMSIPTTFKDLLCTTLQYPYIPAHITQPKECKKIFIVPLPETCTSSSAFPCGLPLCHLEQSLLTRPYAVPS